MPPLAAEARRVHDQAQLSDRRVATATGARPSTVRDWLSRRSAAGGARADRLVALGAVVGRLARVMQADFIPIWLSRPIEALDDEEPVEVLARGDYRRIAKRLGELESPGASLTSTWTSNTVAVDGDWVRHAPHRSSLLGRASEATDGRWQHGEVVRALPRPAKKPAQNWWLEQAARDGTPRRRTPRRRRSRPAATL